MYCRLRLSEEEDVDVDEGGPPKEVEEGRFCAGLEVLDIMWVLEGGGNDVVGEVGGWFVWWCGGGGELGATRFRGISR